MQNFGKHQLAIGESEKETDDDDPRVRLRKVIGYLENKRERMKHTEYGWAGLPMTSAWIESAVKQRPNTVPKEQKCSETP